MFDRFSEKARRTIFFARYEASQFGSDYIEAEHLLLGILREDRGQRSFWRFRSRSFHPLVGHSHFPLPCALVLIREGIFTHRHARQRQRGHLNVVDDREPLQACIAGELAAQAVFVARRSDQGKGRVEICVHLLPFLSSDIAKLKPIMPGEV